MKQILFLSVKKKIKNKGSEHRSDAIGDEIEPVASAGGHDVFLYHFGQAAVGNTDDDGEQNGSFLVGQTIGNELFAIPPKAGKGEACIHEDMRHLVEAHNGLDMGKQRPREHCQKHDNDSAQDSRDAISG